MTDMDGAPPASPRTPSQGADGGFNSSDVRGYLLWAVSYGVASAIALRTIDAFTSKPTNQLETENEKEKEKDKTITCQVVFPSVTTIINSNDPSTIGAKKNETAASSTPTKVSEKTSGNVFASETFKRGKETVAAASNRAQGVFNRTKAPQAHPAEPSVPHICKHVFDFYQDCVKGTRNVCEGYAKVTKKCQQLEIQNSYQASPQGQSGSIITAGSTSTNISNVSNPTLSVSPALILMSYFGCRYRNYDLSDCKKYETYMSKTFKDNI